MDSTLYASMNVVDYNMPCVCENDDLIAKLNESKKLVEKYKKLVEHSLEKLKEFECRLGS